MYQSATTKQCPNPNCNAPMSEEQTSCGRGTCRQYVYRQNQADRLKAEREAATEAVRVYCEQYLPAELGAVIQSAAALVMANYKENGPAKARQVIEAIELKRCKHARIQILIDNAAAAKRRADHAEAANASLEAHYKQQIRDLEADLHVYQANERVIYGIGQQQLAQQSEEEVL
jgi:hypothetical protein